MRLSAACTNTSLSRSVRRSQIAASCLSWNGGTKEEGRDKLEFADTGHQEVGQLPEIEIPISDVDYAVALKKEVGTQ